MTGFKKGIALILAVITMFSSFYFGGFASETAEYQYVVETYYMNTFGVYSESPDESSSFKAVAGEKIVLNIDETDGFTFDPTKSVTEFEVKTDGTSVGKIYYSRNLYTATYIYEDLLGPQTEESLVYYGAEIPSFEANPSGIPAKQGYNFIMWSLEENSETALPSRMPAEDINIYPIYKIKSYTYIFDAGEGGSFSNGEQTITIEYDYGDIPETPEKPTMPHMEFIDWDNNIPSTVSENMNFTALYNELTYSAIFMDGENELSYMDGYYYGDIIEEIDIPEGYDAWTLSDGTYVTFPYTIEGNTVFYASDAPSEYTVSFYLDNTDTEPYEEFTVIQGDEIDFPADPEKTGYIFIGWEGMPEDGLMPAENITVTAKWQKTVAEDSLSFKTEIYTLDDTSGEWVVAEKVERGETVKARIFIETGFAVGTGQVLCFYNDDVFTMETVSGSKLNVNTSASSSSAKHGASGNYATPSKSHTTFTDLVDFGYISEEFLETHSPVTFTFSFASFKCHSISGDEWFAEFELTAKEDAVGMGNFFVVPETIANSEEGYYAYIDLSRGEEDGSSLNTESLFSWNPSSTVESKPVSTGYGRVTFDADGGNFADGSSINILTAEEGKTIVIPYVEREGYEFERWDCDGISYESGGSFVMPSSNVTFNAIWIEIPTETTTEPSTLPVTEPTTETTTNPVTEPSTTEPVTEPSTTEPVTEPATTKPVTEPTTAETTTIPATQPTTKPSTESTTNPVTEPSTTEPITEPSTTEPVTEPATTKPVTEPTTAESTTIPTTQPTTKPVETTTKPTTVHTHSLKTVVENATCEKAGKSYQVCNECEKIVGNTEVIPAIGHSAGEWQTLIEPTYEKEGKKIKKCTRNGCGKILEEASIPVLEPETVDLSIKKPSMTTISYGDSIYLHAIVDLPADAEVVWTANNSNFTYSTSADGKTCLISPASNGETEFTAKVVDKKGNVISEICTQKMTSKAGFFQKIIAFFKKLFGLTKVYPDGIKTIYDK